MNYGIGFDARRWLCRAILLQVLVGLALGGSAIAQNRPVEPVMQGEGSLKVMTYNMYVGTEYTGVTDPRLAVMLQGITNMVLDMRASEPAERAQAIARQIAETRPHLVSLQEVATLSKGTSRDKMTMEFDYLQLLLDSLTSLGVRYTPAASFETWRATLPSSTGEFVNGSWRVVILARADLKTEDFSFTNAHGAKWTTVQSFPLPALDGNADWCPAELVGSACVMPFPRGWAAVDVVYRGKQFRYINVHLESLSASKNIKQGLELLNGPANTLLPVIVAGDLNCDLSNPNDAKYQTCLNVLNAGFGDTWGAANPGADGFTKDMPVMTMRGDYVMARGRFGAQASVLVGEEQADRTETGLWPSNHCGVVSRLRLADE
jgi:endonuclease/exonuclease/phosphatase family metal-dependent hydrolase